MAATHYKKIGTEEN